jgi:hypothetical protein
MEPKFDEQFSNQIRQITKGFENAAGTLRCLQLYRSQAIRRRPGFECCAVGFGYCTK